MPGDEQRVVAVVEADFAGEGVVFADAGIARDLDAFVASLKGDVRTSFALPAVETDLDGAVLDVAGFTVELDVNGSGMLT